MTKEIKQKYDLGDIVFVNEYAYENSTQGKNHLFVVIADDDKAIPLEYFGLIVSSQINKSKENSKHKYNEPLSKSDENGLNYESIVKCDQLYNLPKDNVMFKIGHVDVDDFMRFIDAYDKYINQIDKELETV